MKKLILGMMLMAFAGVTMASTVFVWTAPTTYTNGQAMPASAIAGYNIYCGTASGSYGTPYNVTGNTAVSTLISNVETADGTYYCAMTTLSTDGSESAKSNEIEFSLASGVASFLVPAVPGGFTLGQ